MVLNMLRSRSFAKKIMLTLLILIIPAFVLWGIGGVGKKPGLVGRIGNKKIYADDLAKSREGMRIQLLFSNYGNFETIEQILKNRTLLNLMAWERLIFLNIAKDEKIALPLTREVISFIARQVLFQKNGVFDKPAYYYLLRTSLHMEAREFEELIRENMLVKKLQTDILRDIRVSDEEILEYYKKTHDKAELAYIIIDKEAFLGGTEISDKDAEIYYEENKENFFDPPKIKIEYMDLPYETASQKDTVTQTIDELYSRLKLSPDKLEETAKKEGFHYAKTKVFSREETAPGIVFFEEFYDAAFALEKGNLSLPLFSSPEKGNAYLIRKIEDIPSQPKNFEDAKTSIIKTLKEEKGLVKTKEKADELYSRIVSSETTLEKIAAEIGQEIQTTEAIAIDGYIENAGPAQRLIEEALKSEEGKILSPFTSKKGTILAQLNKIIPADTSEFDKNKEHFRNQLLSTKQADTIGKWLNKNSHRIKLESALDTGI